MSQRTNRNAFVQRIGKATTLSYGVILLTLLAVIWMDKTGSSGAAAADLRPAAFAGTPTPTVAPSRRGRPTLVFFVTPPPVRTEEPLSPDSRNVPSVFPGIDEYDPVHAILNNVNQPSPPVTTLAKAALAVVQIRRCDNFGCETPTGSGVMIHPRGLILTAYHVLLTEPDDPTAPRYPNFVIAMTEDLRTAPSPRYQARLVASKVDQDLAILAIERTTAGEPVDSSQLALPTLPLADVTTLFGDDLHVLGYPVTGGEAVNYVRTGFSSFDDRGRLIVVDRSLDPGNSGGPALVRREDGFAIAGLVIRRRSTQGQLSQQGLVRAIDQLHSLTWTPRLTRAWGEGVQAYTQTTETTTALHLALTLNTVDLIDQPLRLLFYATDIDSDQPWYAHNAAAPLVIWADVEPQAVIDRQILTLTVPEEALGITPDRLRFRALLWDITEGNPLWTDDEGVQAMSATSPAATPTLAEPATATATQTATPTKAASPTPQLPATHTPTPDAIATAMSEATAEARLQRAVAATLTAAAPTPTPTPFSLRVKTDTLNIRSGPGLTYAVVSSVGQNSELQVVGQAYNCEWFQVYYRGTATGWVSGLEQFVEFAGNCSAIPAVEIPPTPAPPTFTPTPIPWVLTVSGREYRVMRQEEGNGLAVNQPVYTDRNYLYSAIPAALQGATYIVTTNEDKWSNTNTNLLEINSNKEIQVYVAYSDGFVTKAGWLEGYQDTGLDLKFTDNEAREVTLSLYTRSFSANAPIVLGGNTPEGSGSSSMYTVVLQVLE